MGFAKKIIKIVVLNSFFIYLFLFISSYCGEGRGEG